MSDSELDQAWRKAIEGLRGSGVPPTPESPALMVVDMQRYFLEEGAPAFLPTALPLIPRVNRLIQAFDELGSPIFATRYASSQQTDPIVRWWGTRLEPTDPYAEIDPRIVLPEGTPVLEKHLYGTFHSTDVHSRLRERNVRSVVICGVMTDLCCETTAREAFQHGYSVYFMADGSASSDASLHHSALATLAHGFAHVLSVKEMVQLLEGGDG